MEETTPQSAKKGMSPMMIGGIVLLLVVLVGAIVYMTQSSPKSALQTTNTPTATPSEPVKSDTTTGTSEGKMEASVKTFEVEASNFKFSVATMAVNEGDTVKITFKNSQGFHDFVLDEFNVKTKTISSGQSEEVQFVANKKGTFEYYCSVGNHRAMGMVGKLTVN